MFKITTQESKVTPEKQTIKLENISVKDLRLVDTDTGEDISEQVIAAIPFEKINFKITFETPESADESSDDEEE